MRAKTFCGVRVATASEKSTKSTVTLTSPIVRIRFATRGKPSPIDENFAGNRHSASGSPALTVSAAVPDIAPLLAVIEAWPGPTPVTTPPPLTVATTGDPDDQVTVPVAIAA